MSEQTPREREAQETLEWINDWRDGMFTPAHTSDGWTVEMYGLVDSAERHAQDVLALMAVCRNEALSKQPHFGEHIDKLDRALARTTTNP